MESTYNDCVVLTQSFVFSCWPVAQNGRHSGDGWLPGQEARGDQREVYPAANAGPPGHTHARTRARTHARTHTYTQCEIFI